MREVFWFACGMNAAYVVALVTVWVVLKRGGKLLAVNGELLTVAPVGTAAVLAWFVASTLLGPWWALLVPPALFACALAYAYVRVRRAEVA